MRPQVPLQRGHLQREPLLELRLELERPVPRVPHRQRPPHLRVHHHHPEVQQPGDLLRGGGGRRLRSAGRGSRGRTRGWEKVEAKRIRRGRGGRQWRQPPLWRQGEGLTSRGTGMSARSGTSTRSPSVETMMRSCTLTSSSLWNTTSTAVSSPGACTPRAPRQGAHPQRQSPCQASGGKGGVGEGGGHAPASERAGYRSAGTPGTAAARS